MEQSRYLMIAIEAARAAEEVITHYYWRSPSVRLKADQSPVTEADVEAEKVIREVIRNAFPEHGFYGEELGEENSGAELTWLVDPIDGTKSFIRQYPFFSTQIALKRGEQLILGVSNAPLFSEMAYAERGAGAFLGDELLQVSGIEELGNAIVSFGNIETLANTRVTWEALGELVQSANRTRGYGDFYHYHLLAAGKIDLVVESDINILDIAALSVIVTEAGGQFSDLEGRPLSLETTSVLAAGSQTLHEAVRHRFRNPKRGL